MKMIKVKFGLLPIEGTNGSTAIYKVRIKEEHETTYELYILDRLSGDPIRITRSLYRKDEVRSVKEKEYSWLKYKLSILLGIL